MTLDRVGVDDVSIADVDNAGSLTQICHIVFMIISASMTKGEQR